MEMETRRTRTARTPAPAPGHAGIPLQRKLDLARRAGPPLDAVRLRYRAGRPAGLEELPVWRPAVPEGTPAVQREPLKSIPGQTGSNCGFHALARAIMAVAGIPVTEYFPNLVTGAAALYGLTVVGEAFDPVALAAAGNAFCDEFMVNQRSLRDVVCELAEFGTEEELSEILQRDRSAIVLVPYFKDEHSEPVENLPPRRPNAHWAAVAPPPEAREEEAEEGRIPVDAPAYSLYEGNRFGSVSPITGLVQGPMPVSARSLFVSNQSITEEFDWVEDYFFQALSEREKTAFRAKGPEEQEELTRPDFRREWTRFRDPREAAPRLAQAVAARREQLRRAAAVEELWEQGRREEARVMARSRGITLKPAPFAPPGPPPWPTAPGPGPDAAFSVKEPVALKGKAVVVRKQSGGASSSSSSSASSGSAAGGPLP